MTVKVKPVPAVAVAGVVTVKCVVTAAFTVTVVQPVQTNEPGRSVSLLGGYLEVARAHPGLPLRVFEVGASAGLNLLWDEFRYEVRGARR